MARKHLKFLLILIMLTSLSGVIFCYLSGKSEQSSQEATKSYFVKLKKDPTIRDFRFSGYHQGKKAITIKAVKFSVEKKKIGIFKFSPLRAARFRGAEINLYLDNIQLTDGLPNQQDIIVKGLFSQETMPTSALKGATSVVFEPVKINCYLDDTNLTEIHARRASLDSRRRRLILQGKILVTSASNQLATERLIIYPEKGIIEVNNTFVLKTQSEKITGDKLTTDFFLKQRG
jgi:hypothetical protein